MNYLFFLLFYTFTALASHAATVELSHTINPRGEVVVSVELNPEGNSINSAEGTISLPKEYFDVHSISTEDSVVSLWLERPQASTIIDLSGLTHIHFAGMIPGGFSGVRSPYYKGGKPGSLFTVTLAAKKTGQTIALLDEATLYMHDGNATRINVGAVSYELAIPSITPALEKPVSVPVENESLRPYIVKHELAADGAWALILQNDETRYSVDRYEVAESKEFFPENISSYEWKKAESPYVLTRQKRNVFVHIKALYSDGTYSYVTLPPVENISSTLNTSSILILVSIVLLVALYAIRKHLGKGK